MILSKLGNKNSDAGHIKCSHLAREPPVLHLYSSGWAQVRYQLPKIYLTYDVTHKTRNPKPNFFFIAEDLPNLLRVLTAL